MICPHCKSQDNRVLETRSQREGEVRRRRECSDCRQRFTTIESWLIKMPYVVKRTGAKEPFRQDKLRKGLQLACLKRPVSLPQIEHIVSRITQYISSRNEKEMSSLVIGEQVMKELKQLDHVAYVRFASVYRTFEDVQEFVRAIEREMSDNV